MKSIFMMLLGAALIFTSSCSSEKAETEVTTESNETEQINVPEVVSAAFTAKFPSATDVEWEMETETEYEANFEMYEKEYSAKFDQTGKWLETETIIAVADLPEVVTKSLNKEFPDYVIDEAEKADTFDKGTVYEVEVEKGEETYVVLVAADGTILKKELDNEDENDEGDEGEDDEEDDDDE